MSGNKVKLDPKVKLQDKIKQMEAKLEAIEARENVMLRKLQARGAIVFSGYAFKEAPELLLRAIAELEARPLGKKEKLDLDALIAFRDR